MSKQAESGFIAEQLGQCVTASCWDELPLSLRYEAKRSLLNFVGGALGVAQSPPIDMAMRVLTPLSGADRVTVLGRPEQLDVLNAAFINAISANLLDYDDTHLETVIHPTAPVAPAALALAEQRGLSGAAMLHAFILGAEVECRIGNAVSPGHYVRGWHITSTCGVFGSAVASAKLLGLDAQQTLHAIGIAASQSAGVIENLPSAAKNVGVGNAARNGLFAALLAEQGYTAAPAAIEGPLGWARAMGDDPVVAKMTNGIGQEWELLKNTYKPYPCGIVMHAVVDACLALRRDHAITPSDIAEIIVSGDQLLLDRGDRTVANDRDARVSIHHCAAVSFLFGAAGLKEFSEEAVHDPAVVALRSRAQARLKADSPRGAATATVRTTDGRSLETTVLHARGSTQHPLSDQEIEAKVRELAGHGGFRGSIDDLIAAVWQLDTAATIAPLIEALRQGQRNNTWIRIQQAGERPPMKAMLLTGHGGPDMLQYGDAPDPTPAPDEIVVDVHAASVNAADYKVRLGSYNSKLRFPYILGRDFSGVVAATGADVADFAVGDAVFGVLAGGVEGAYAEKLAIKAAIVARKPDRLSHLQAAALALIGITAIWAIEDTAQRQAGETILIQGGAGGVAGFAIQLAKYLGATVITTTSAANIDYVRSLGADRVIDYNAEDFTKVVSGCDVVFDTVGGEVQARSYSVLKPGGRLVWVAPAPEGFRPPRPDVKVLRPAVTRDRAHLERIVALLDAGAISPPPVARYALADAAEAHRVSEARHLRGKLVLAVR